MRTVHRKALGIIGSGAALLSLTSATAAHAAANPGQPVLNDYGQSPAEVAAEVAAAVNADPTVVATRRAVTAAHAAVLVRQRAENAAHAAYVKAAASKVAARIKTTRAAYLAAHAATVKAKASEAARRAALTKLINAKAAAVRAKHYLPVDGAWAGAVSQYFIPSIGLEPIQVQVSVYGGHVSDVTVPQYASTGDSASYNAMALPVLMQEAMAAHDTAQVASVTGATLTSESFRNSLLSALLKAGWKY